MSKLLTAKEVAEILGSTPAWVSKLCRTGALKAIRVSPKSPLRFTEKEVRDFGLRPGNTLVFSQPSKLRDELFCLYYDITEEDRKLIFQGKATYNISRQLLWQRLRVARGLCPGCGKKAAPERRRCALCQSKIRIRHRALVKEQKLAKKQALKKTSPNKRGKQTPGDGADKQEGLTARRSAIK